jgi:hypothetical protein
VSEEGIVWIASDPSPDGSTYLVTVEFSDDRSIPLTPQTAPRYAMTILEAMARAEDDAAVVAQMSEAVQDRDAVVAMIRDIDQDRPSIDYSPTEPLILVPGVDGKGEPFLHVQIDGKLVGQWTMEGARDHACAALQMTAVADLDAGYYRALIGLIGLEPARARGVVHDLANYRQEWR